MKQPPYIFVVGAPGSKWSGVARSIYMSPMINRTDHRDSNVYNHRGTAVNHIGSYFDPGMEYGDFFDHIEDYSREECEAEFDRPFSDTEGPKIIKSHVLSKKIHVLRERWPNCPIVMVLRKDDDCWLWWKQAGGFDITYPSYEWYRDEIVMRGEIASQNRGIEKWFHKGKQCSNSNELAEVLGILDPEIKDFSAQDTQVSVLSSKANETADDKITPHLLEFIQNEFEISVDASSISALAEEIHDKVLSRYFGPKGAWKPDTNKFNQTGEAIIKTVNDLDPERVLDVGCGYNLLKGKIKNLYGIDPYNDAADEVVSILDFVSPPTTWDVVLCLGSVNFGGRPKIEAEMEKVIDLLKPGGHLFMRVNPGLPHPRPESRWIQFYGWNEEELRRMANHFGMEVIAIEPDAHRLYSHWRKPK